MPEPRHLQKPERSLRQSVRLLLFALALVSCPLPQPAEAQQKLDAPGKTLWLIPHTHWEGAVFKTREEYLTVGLPHIQRALELLKKYPEYRFVLDQVAYVKPFLERYPDEAPIFRKFVAEGRIQLVGAQDIMPDMNIPSGESWIRQVLYGKGYYREKLGADVTVGWGLDPFGHHPQLPQLLKLAGFKSYWFQRGVKNDGTPSEFMWEGIDGTQIPAFWLPWSYALFHPAPGNLMEFDRYTLEQWEKLGQYSAWPDRVALVGADVTEPEEAMPVLVRQFNQSAGSPVTLRFGVPTDFEKAVAARPNPPVVKADLNPVFQGVYSSRIELKQWVRTLERQLGTAEALSAIASWLGAPSANERLTRAWEPVLFNQAHDLMSGTMVDKVHLETVKAYESSKSLADELIDADLNAIEAQIDTKGEGTPYIVFNKLGWSRTDAAEIDVEFPQGGPLGLQLRDSNGQIIPIQFVSSEQDSNGHIGKARIAFVARDVPALGYSIYHMVPSSTGSSSAGTKTTASTWHEDQGSMENEFYRVQFDLWTGEMTRLELKSGNWNALGDAPANVVAREQDGGDLWELYGNLNGARLTAMTRKSLLPAPWRSSYSHEWVGGDGSVLQGPVFSQFQISHPFGEGKFATRVRLYNGVRRVDIKTEITNNNKLVRYRALFPTSLKSGRRFDEIPFGAVERPVEQEFPAQNWIDYSDGARGVALLNRGIPGANVVAGTLVLSLLRSASISAYPFIGGYEAGVSSDLGLELGVERSFDYALVPHDGDWQAAEVYRAGWEFNHPLVARKVGAHAGKLSSRWGLFDFSANNVVVSAVKPGSDDSTVIRVYEAAGLKSKGVKIKFNTAVASVLETGLMENGGAALAVADNSILVDLRPYEIKTLKLKLQPYAARK